MCSAALTAPAPSSHFTRLAFRLKDTTEATFTFHASPKPDMVLTFSPRPSPPRARKRCRAATDIDGEISCVYKKKRRLRLFLITSRLSPQYSFPATNIVDRGSSKIAVWAKQKALGRNILRKAAILNSVRRRAMYARDAEGGFGRSFVEQEREQKQLELARLAFAYGSHDTHTRPVIQRGPSFPPMTAVRVGDRFEVSGSPNIGSPSPNLSPVPSSDDDEIEQPIYQSPNDAYAYPPPRAQIPRRTHFPLPPSPLGLSNYDAFDLDDEIPDPYAHLDDDDDDQSFDDDDGAVRADDLLSSSAITSASSANPVATAEDRQGKVARTPPQKFYSDFSVLDPGEPVVGDYDQVDDGAHALWPSAFGAVPTATAEETPSPPVSSSPNFTALLATADAVSRRLSQGSEELESCSPNFPPRRLSSSNESVPYLPDSGFAIETNDQKEQDLSNERARQRKLMFLPFNS
ncbi:hypothetical protein K491DRAFT_712456 [Lophiostoma macrostomum CBS 122681]|uniref:Uncharacterized protein n=1 Tax=Lophiostoma macrostomum CBS 122681 TaxID=1314788 RepID=A0A6A6TJR6_9PLEO|nr:hypothetical protein K491DRAFT_712456 [Lophiostoma macrostomum CBS 122681]